MAALVDERQIRGEGDTANAEWQTWLAELAPPCTSIDDLIASAQRLVVVAPHPDDEVLGCGGLLGLHARQGGESTIIAVTDGEASHADDPVWSPDRLARARRAERTKGLAHLGVRPSACLNLGLPDGAVALHRDSLGDSLRHILRADDLVITTWHLDGHPDHDAVGDAATAACAAIGCRLLQVPVWMWHWATPADPRVPWQRLRALPLPGAVQATKAAALLEHVSQLTARGSAQPVLGPAILARAAWRQEYFLC